MPKPGSTPRRRATAAGLAIGAVLAMTACGGADPGSDPDHEAVSVPPVSTVAPPTDAPLTMTGGATDPLDSTNFGMHIVQVDEAAWPDVPIGAVRVWNADSTWGALERTPGAWTFANLDKRVAQAEARGAPVLLVLTHPPRWAATRPELKGYQGSPSPPKSDGDWQNYIRTVVQRYAGRIEAYEIWNEPNLPQFFAGTPERMAELTILAAAEVRAADPEALVVSAGFSARTPGSVPFFTTYINAMPPETVDILGIHIYPYTGYGPESMIELAAQFRGLAEAAGFEGKPMWNTEIGYGHTPDQIIAGDVAASLILRTYMVLPAYGLERNYWYMWDDRAFVGLYLVEEDRLTESAAAAAYADAQNWLDGASVVECGDRGAGVWTCDLNKEGNLVTVAWRYGALSASYTVPDGMTVAYPFTGDPVPVSGGDTVALLDLPVLYSPVEIPSLVG